MREESLAAMLIKEERFKEAFDAFELILKKSPKNNFYLTTLQLNNYSHLPIPLISATLKLPHILDIVSIDKKTK